ncbi:MAG: hypothetical protein WCT36_01235 [Candidatus Gracilibacteria bacterium]
MADENNAIFSITSDGVNSEITINTPPGASVKTNSTETYMQNIDQTSTCGEISHNSNNLTQIGGSQSASEGGKITNRVENGTLFQENIDQSAESGGEIMSEVVTPTKPEISTEAWHSTWWGILSLAIAGGIIIAFIVYKLGWN